LFHQADKFQFQLQKLDEQGNPQYVIHWAYLVRKNTNEFSFIDYTNKFLYIVSCFLIVMLFLGFPLQSREFSISMSKQILEIGFCIKTIQRSEYMDVRFLHINCLSLYQLGIFHLNILGRWWTWMSCTLCELRKNLILN